MAFCVDWHEQGVVFNFHIVTKLDDIIAADRILYENLTKKSLKYVVYNHGDTCLLDINKEQISALAVSDRIESIGLPKLKMAIVSTVSYSVELTEEYLKVANLLKLNWTLKHFYSVDDAIQWCDE